jgi:hypothetical protein
MGVISYWVRPEVLVKGNKLDGYLGHFHQDYDDINALIYGMDFIWYPTNKIKITSKIECTQNETTEVGASSYLSSYMDLQFDQKLSKNTLVYVNLNCRVEDFQDVGREDVTLSLGIDVKN